MPCRRCGAAEAGRGAGPPSCTKAFDYPRCRRSCWARRIKPRLARRGVGSSERLGRHRWVVERTRAWLSRLRRLTVRYERRADIPQAFPTLGCALICFNQLQRFCEAL